MAINSKRFSLWNRCKEYLAHSNIHGFKYVVEPNRHWTERVFWLIACGLSIWACTTMVMNTIKFAMLRDVTITAKTDYVKYSAPVPALHFCVVFNKRVKKFLRLSTNTLEYSSLGLGPGTNRIPTEEEFIQIDEYVRPTCQNFLHTCLWNDEKFNCCDYFFPLNSNTGPCLSFNSLQTAGTSHDQLTRFSVDHRMQEARLTIFFKATEYVKNLGASRFLLLNVFDYPTATIANDRQFKLKFDGKSLVVIDVNSLQVSNNQEVIEMAKSVRDCQMSYENKKNLLMKWYNFDGCVMEIQMRKMFNLTGCISHIFPRIPSMRICNLTELKAAEKFYEEIKTFSHTKCLPDCEGCIYDFHVNIYEISKLPDDMSLQLEINMLPGPSKQYERYPTRSLLQVVIAVGSVVGLFMGASLLSIIEIIYWLFIRRNV